MSKDEKLGTCDHINHESSAHPFEVNKCINFRMASQSKYRDPSTEELESPLFEAIWKAIKSWDISRESNGLYSGATGTDVCIILDAIKAVIPLALRPTGRIIPDLRGKQEHLCDYQQEVKLR